MKLQIAPPQLAEGAHSAAARQGSMLNNPSMANLVFEGAGLSKGELVENASNFLPAALITGRGLVGGHLGGA